MFTPGIEIVVYDIKKKSINTKGKTGGFFLFGLAVGFIILFFVPVFYAEAVYRKYKIENSFSEKPVFAAARTSKETLSRSIDSQTAKYKFNLWVPSVGINTKVTAFVDPDSKENYSEALEDGLALARGTFLPGRGRLSYIFGHSSVYPGNSVDAILYPLNYVKKGDEIYVYIENKVISYRVADKKIVPPQDVKFLTSELDKNQLIIQTCWPPNTSWERLLIIAKPFEDA